MTTVTNLPPEATVPSALPVTISKDAKTEDRPDCEREALQRMRPLWEWPDLLLSGTKGMRESTILQQEHEEKDEEYQRRKNRPVLTNYYGNTLATHSGLPFASSITFDPPLPERMAYLERDADGCGKSITVFTRDVLKDGMHRGLSHVMVDVPSDTGADYAATLKRQPRMVHIETGALLGIDDEPGPTGDDIVTYARFVQQGKKQVGRFGETATKFIMEIEVGPARSVVNVYEKQAEDSWSVRQTPYTPKAIPLFTFYSDQTGEYEGKPAYSYLAELNVAHYQSDADQRHALSYGRRATVVQTGWKDVGGGPAEAAARAAAGQTGTPRDVLGYGRKMRSPNDAASASLLETNGKPLEAGREDAKALEERMERFGAAQISKEGGITAKSRELDDKRDTCNLEAWCTRLEGVLLNAITAVAELMGMKLPANQKVKIPRDFSADKPKAEDMPQLQQLAKEGFLTPVTLLREAKVRGMLHTVDDPDKEAAAAADLAAKAQAAMDAAIANAAGTPGGVDPPPGEDADAA